MSFVLVRLTQKKKLARWQLSAIKRGLNLTMGFSEEDFRREPQDRHFMQTTQTLLQHDRGKTQLQHCLDALCTKTSVGRSVLRQTLETMLNDAKSSSDAK